MRKNGEKPWKYASYKRAVSEYSLTYTGLYCCKKATGGIDIRPQPWYNGSILKNGDYIMFKILKEITVWNSEYTVYNHTYLLDPKNRIIAYYNVKDKTIHKLNSPYVIDKKYRKFVETKHVGLSKLIPKDYKEERQENTMPSAFVRVFKVKSKSKNKTYEVSFQINTKQLSCGCTGYGYRRTCSHVKAVANKLGV